MQILSSLEYAIKRKRFPELLPVLTLPFPHLFAFSSLVMRFLLRLREEVFHLALPVEEEKEQSDAACATDEIPYFSIHSHRLLRDANKRDADKCHEELLQHFLSRKAKWLVCQTFLPGSYVRYQ